MSTEDGRQRSRAGLCTRLPLPAGAKGDAMADETGLEEREREMAGWLAVEEEASIRGLHSFVSSLSVSCPCLSDGYTLPFSLLCLLSVCLSGSLAFSFIHTTHIHPLQSSLAHAPWVLHYHYCHTALTSSSTSIIITGRTKAGGLDLSLRPESFSRAAYPACTALAPC